MIAFGPVPSRRLGKSIGINNIPPKTCTYACIYCQLGKAIRMQGEREVFYSPDTILRETQDILERINTRPDYLTIVSDGEPTLDARLGTLIDELRKTGCPVAVISNASLIGHREVQNDLRRADTVSLKLDAASEVLWRKVNKPLRSLSLDKIIAGMQEFASGYQGHLITETMLVKGINDSEESLRKTAETLRTIEPETAYIAIPTRPPAFADVEAPEESTLVMAMDIYSSLLPKAEYLIGYEGDEFYGTGDTATDLLNILAVHPMRQEAVEKFLKADNAGWNIVEDLLVKQEIVRSEYRGNSYYTRRLQKVPKQHNQ